MVQISRMVDASACYRGHFETISQYRLEITAFGYIQPPCMALFDLAISSQVYDHHWGSGRYLIWWERDTPL